MITRLLFAFSTTGDNNLAMRLSLPALIAAAGALGIKSEFADLDTPEGFRRLIKSLDDESCCIFTGIWCYDLAVIGFAKCTLKNLYSNVAAKLIAVVGDHPFSDFMHRRIENASPHFAYLVTEDSFAKPMHEISGRQLNCYRYNAVTTPLIEHSRITSYGDRPVAIFFPMSIDYIQEADVSLELKNLPTEIRAIAASVYNEYSLETRVSAYEFFRLRARLDPDVCLKSRLGRNVYFSLLRILSAVDFKARFGWRVKRISQLANILPGQEIVIAGRPHTAVRLPKNVRFTGYLDFKQLCSMYLRSRVIYHCHPTYFHGLHERPIHAQMFGCLLVTENLPWTSSLAGNSFVAVGESLDQVVKVITSTAWPNDIDCIPSREISERYGTQALIQQILLTCSGVA
jgi:hypothetical protein